jgi:hypothetical protein
MAPTLIAGDRERQQTRWRSIMDQGSFRDIQRSVDGGATVYGSATTLKRTSPLIADQCVDPDGSCAYRIRAILDGGYTAWSAWKARSVPPAPTLNRAVAGDGGVNVFFTPPPLHGYQTVRGYEVQRSVESGASVYGTGTTQKTASPLIADRCGDPDGPCAYRIRAILDGGYTAWSAWISEGTALNALTALLPPELA